MPGPEGRRALPVVDEELALLEAVRARIAALPRSSHARERALVEELVRLREQLLSPATAKTDLPALQEQWNRGNAVLRQLQNGEGAPLDADSPYFAHLRLSEAGSQRDLCLGRATCIQEGVRIVDWRNAPVSRIYYRYEQGEEYEEVFAGRTRAGRVEVRRAVQIRDGVLVRVEAPEGTFERAGREFSRVREERARLAGGEAQALRSHGGGRASLLGNAPGGRPAFAERRLAEITALIDPDQFELIARPEGFVAIRGSAGSGKTTVALHRLAFLAFADRAVDSAETLFVTFSPALCAYVSHVLPALGLTRVGVVTYRAWAAELRHRHFSDLPDSGRDDAPAAVQRLKLHPLAGAALARHVREHPGPASAGQAYDDYASALCRRELLGELARRLAPGEWSEAQLDEVVDWQRRRNEEVALHLAGEGDTGSQLEPEDDTLLLRAWQLRVGPLLGPRLRPLQQRHVAIDEVQDFSPLEVQVLLETLDRRRSLTLAGDSQQQLLASGSFGSWSRFLAGLGLPGSALETLRVGYRCSREIMDVALALLGGLREDAETPLAVRSGPPVEWFPFAERGACVAFLVDALRGLMEREPLASVAVLAPSRELSSLYASSLASADLPRLRQVRDQEFCFLPGIDVTEIEQVRGLEYDYVLVVEADALHFPEGAESRRRLHVAATRALHQLWITSTGPPAPALREALAAGSPGPAAAPAGSPGA